MSLIHSNIIAIGEAGIGGLRSVTDPIQFSIDICKADNAMFEALIQCDFMEAVCESGEISREDYQVALEAAGDGIWQKIKDFFKKALDYLTGFFKKAVDFVAHLFDKDARLFKKYEHYVQKNASRFDAKGDFEYIDMDVYNYFLNGGQISQNDIISNMENLSNCSDKDSVESILKTIKDKVESTEKELDSKFGDLVKKANGGSDLLSKIKVSEVEQFIISGKGNTVKALKTNFDNSKKELNALKSRYDNSKSIEKKENSSNELWAAKYNAIFSALSIYQKLTNKEKSAALKAIKEAYRVNRKIYITLGQYGMKQKSKDTASASAAEEKAATESYYWALGNISDTYVEETYVEAFA